MSATVTQDRYRVGSKSLHVVQQGDLGWVCWLNIEDIDFSGLMLSSGETRADCVGEAMRVLQSCIEILERPPLRAALTDYTWHALGRPCGAEARQDEGITEYPEHINCPACLVSTRTGRLG